MIKLEELRKKPYTAGEYFEILVGILKERGEIPYIVDDISSGCDESVLIMSKVVIKSVQKSDLKLLEGDNEGIELVILGEFSDGNQHTAVRHMGTFRTGKTTTGAMHSMSGLLTAFTAANERYYDEHSLDFYWSVYNVWTGNSFDQHGHSRWLQSKLLLYNAIDYEDFIIQDLDRIYKERCCLKDYVMEPSVMAIALGLKTRENYIYINTERFPEEEVKGIRLPGIYCFDYKRNDGEDTYTLTLKKRITIKRQYDVASGAEPRKFWGLMRDLHVPKVSIITDSAEPRDIVACVRKIMEYPEMKKYMEWYYDKGIIGAVSRYQREAELGYAEAPYELGRMYKNGDGVEKNYAKALHWYQIAAGRGHAEAQHDLALMYERGQGVKKDEENAIHWHEKAAAQGNEDSRKRLSRLYINQLDELAKRGDEYFAAEDYKFARTCYWTPANYGNREAQYMLGRACLKLSYKKDAKYWLQRAAQQGHAQAKRLLTRMRNCQKSW